MKWIIRSIIVMFGLYMFSPALNAQSWSLNFDGNDYVLIASSHDFSIVNEITVETWIKVNTFDKDWQAIVTRGDDSWRIHRYNNTNLVAFSTNGLSNQDLASSTEVNDGQWHHIAAVYDGSTKHIYIDGELDASVGVTGTLSTNNKNVMIAENCDYYNRGFKGKIDEVRIWDEGLSQNDINDLTCGLPETIGDSLVAWYQMSDGSGTNLTDDSGNGHTGSLNGPPTWDTEDYTSSFPEGSQCNPYTISTLDDLEWLMNNEDIWDDGAYFSQTADIDAAATSGWDGGQGYSPIGTITATTDPFIGHYDGQGYCIDQLFIDRPSVSYIGLFGYIEGSTIENLGLTNVDITGHQATAALVGDAKSNSHIENCYSTGTLNNDESLMGGLIGSLTSSTVKHCYSSANLSHSSYHHYNFGGLIAMVNEGALVENCYSTGNLNASFCFDVGGFAGCLDGTSAEIKNCYSTGAVDAYSLYDGGFLGNYCDGSVLNCFWNTETSGLSTSEGGTGLTITEMKEAGSFLSTGWDFSLSGNHWGMNDTENNGYPFLRFQDMSSDHIWLGGNSTDWNTAANWSENSIPANDVIIPDETATNEAILPSDATITINKLTVETGGNMTVESAADGTGSLIVTNDASGILNFERYMDVNAKSPKWHYISSPLMNVAIDDDFMTDNSIYSPNGGTNYNFYRWDEDTKYWIIYGSTGDPEAFDDENFVVAKGYALSRTSEGVITFSGNYNNNHEQIAVSYTSDMGEGWNLVGNPYSTALAITADASLASDQFLTNANNQLLIDDNYMAIYIWDEGSGYTYGQDDYKVIGNPVMGSYTQIDQDYVQPGQAFMVKTATGNLQFYKEMRAHVSVDFYKEKEIWPSLELLVEGNGLSNTTAIGFHEDMTKGLDPSYDVGKLKGNPDIALYTRLLEDNGVDFALQALPDNRLEDFIIPIGLDVSQNGVYKFSATQENLDNYNLILEDRFENTFTDLRWEPYYAEISESGTGRLYMHFKDATTLGENLHIPGIQIYAADKCIFINGAKSGTLTLSDLTGRAIVQQDLTGEGMISIPVNLQTGIYLVTVQNGKEIKTEKVFIK